jgi:Purple acid Phosphatase, N-terminal domain/Calcineurin-like phosphoesterase
VPFTTRRDVLKGAGVIGLSAFASPVLWRQSSTVTAPLGPRWITYGANPGSQMAVSWSSGTAAGKLVTPTAPAVRWGLDTTYGSVIPASVSRVPVPSGIGEPPENTAYMSAVLGSLVPGTTYHYGVSNDGVTWGPDAAFTTAGLGASPWLFTAFGDQAASASAAAPMARLAASLNPAFHLLAGDLAYATPDPLVIPHVTGFHPAQWDNYLAMISPALAGSIPVVSSVGSHELEPLATPYAGYMTRFAQPVDPASGSPVVRSFTYGNVAVLHLDGNDLSAQEITHRGYTGGAQTTWLAGKLAGYRAPGSGVDFVVCVVNCCCYSSNQNHGSDGGLRDVWGPLFDTYAADLVISGHVHAYERTNPMLAGQPTRQVASGGTVNPATDGTTYICAGGGGNGLYRTWYGSTGTGDAGSATAPKVWRLNSAGKPAQTKDTALGFSACRRALWSCLSVTVTPAAPGGQTTLLVQALAPAQTSAGVTSITAPAAIDSVTISRIAG